MATSRLSSLILGLSTFSMSLLGGAAVRMDVVKDKTFDESWEECQVHVKHRAHVTILYLDGAEKDMKDEVDRFMKDVEPFFPAMRARANKEAGLTGLDKDGKLCAEVHFHEGKFDSNLFGKRIKGYVPTHGAKAFVSLKEQLHAFIEGKWTPPSGGKEDSKAGELKPYNLKVNRKLYDTPHMTVTQESVRASGGSKVDRLNAWLQQALRVTYF